MVSLPLALYRATAHRDLEWRSLTGVFFRLACLTSLPILIAGMIVYRKGGRQRRERRR